MDQYISCNICTAKGKRECKCEQSLKESKPADKPQNIFPESVILSDLNSYKEILQSHIKSLSANMPGDVFVLSSAFRALKLDLTKLSSDIDVLSSRILAIDNDSDEYNIILSKYEARGLEGLLQGYRDLSPNSFKTGMIEMARRFGIDLKDREEAKPEKAARYASFNKLTWLCPLVIVSCLVFSAYERSEIPMEIYDTIPSCYSNLEEAKEFECIHNGDIARANEVEIENIKLKHLEDLNLHTESMRVMHLENLRVNMEYMNLKFEEDKENMRLKYEEELKMYKENMLQEDLNIYEGNIRLKYEEDMNIYKESIIDKHQEDLKILKENMRLKHLKDTSILEANVERLIKRIIELASKKEYGYFDRYSRASDDLPRKHTKISLIGVKKLDLSHQNIRAEGVEILSEFTYPDLEYLNLTSNSIGSEGARTLATVYLPDLVKLDLSNNTLDDEAYVLFKGNFPRLQELYLQGNRISSITARELSRSLLTKLRVLNLEGNKFGASGASELFNSKTSNLIYLNLNDNEIGKRGFNALFECTLPKLLTLNLKFNNITSLAAFDSRKTPLLRVLDLSNNQLSGEGAKFLNLIKLEYLEELHLTNNDIGRLGLKFLSQAELPNLRGLYLGYNKLRGMMRFLVGNLDSLEVLTLENCEILDQDLLSLTPNKLPKLIYLNLFHNYISDQGARYLAMTEFIELETLDLGYNFISTEGMAAFSKSKLANLKHLNLNNQY